MIEAGREATRHAKTLVSIGKSYRFDVKGRDRYGRSICIVQLPGGETYNERMVKDGYAVRSKRNTKIKRFYDTLT